MTGQHSVHYIHQFRERRAILEAALYMIIEGRFQNSAMRDIAFHARLAESTTLHFFPNRATLLDELELYIIEKINAVITEGLQTSHNPKSRFINTWKALNKFYYRNPGILKFVDQSANILGDNARVTKFFDAINKQLAECFNETSGIFTPQQAVSIFQANVISVTKLTSEQVAVLSPDHLNALAATVWNMISRKAPKLPATLPPVVDLQGSD